MIELLKYLLVVQIDKDINAENLGEIAHDLQDVFNPKTLPITIPGENLPDDVPLMIFQSIDGDSLIIKKRRLEFNFQPKSSTNIIDFQFDDTKVTKVLDIFKNNTFPFTKAGMIIDVLGEHNNPNELFNIDFNGFSEDSSFDGIAYNFSKTDRKNIASFGNLLYRIYFDSGIKKIGEDNKKFFLLGLDMNNFEAGENISTPKKVKDFANMVLGEVKTISGKITS